MNSNLTRELKKNTDVMDQTFRNLNLQVLQFTYQAYSDENADCRLFIEIATLDGNEIPQSATIRANLYDENGELFDSDYTPIIKNDFSGYDTFKISFTNNERTLYEAKTARIYMSKNLF